MVGASKILTVSYGTFSCTLEGFDEPFDTMKAIAEYFRDLAAEDRYFGAEPPQPDAEMLHRIAEREMARRVEAKIQKNGVILRPSEGAEALPMPEPVATAPVVPAPPVPVPHAAAVPPRPEPASPAAVDPISESVAAKLQRIRSAVAQARAAQSPVEPDPELDAAPLVLPEPGPAPAQAEAAPVADEATSAEDFAAPEDFGFALDISGPLSVEEAAAILGDTAEASEDAEEDTPAAAPDMAPSMDSEKIERMRRRAERRAARLMQAETQLTAVEETVAEAPAEAPSLSADELSVEAAPSAVAPEPFETETETAADQHDATLEQVMAALAEAEPAPAEPVVDPAPAADIPTDAAPEPAEPVRPVIRARVIKLRRADALPATAPVDAANDSAAVAEEATEHVAPEAAPQDVIAAVSATLASAEPPAARDDTAEGTDPAALSPEAEAELLAELAALTENLPETDWDIEGWSGETTAPAAAPQDTAAEEQPTEDPEVEAFEADLDSVMQAADPEPLPEVDPTPAPVAPREPAAMPPRPASRVPALPEGDLPRLLEKADAQMAGNENRRRISAIAHLKAAVAATVAERRAGGEGVEKDETAPYRRDLTQAVRPRRPVLPTVAESHHIAASRPEVRPAPLVLVSEQRVDRAPAEAVAKAQAVRPRRISATSLPQEADRTSDEESEVPLSPEEASSFAEFAQSRAPQGLAELLEAAAAYTAQVEGRPHFSPPQIMSKVTAIGADSFSREDRLRVFGTLLRQGKIAKVKRGQYAITEASRFYQARAEVHTARR